MEVKEEPIQMLHKTKKQLTNLCCIIWTEVIFVGKLHTRICFLPEAWDVVDFVSAAIFMSKGGTIVRALAFHKSTNVTQV